MLVTAKASGLKIETYFKPFDAGSKIKLATVLAGIFLSLAFGSITLFLTQ